MPQEIGGYLELETASGRGFMHPDGVMLCSGRAAEEAVLRSLGPVARLYLPRFTCGSVFEPPARLGIPTAFYSINSNLEIDEEIELKKDEFLLYTNYFGIKDEYAGRLAQRYKERLIVDNAQALYCPPQGTASAIYSPRKFIGIPDGGIAYSPRPIDSSLPVDSSYGRCSHLLKRIDGGAAFGYGDFKENSKTLSSLPPMQMSRLTRRLMLSADFDRVKEKRRANFAHLNKRLKERNSFNLPAMDSFACPLTYPFVGSREGLRQHLIENNVFVPTYWPDAAGEELARVLVHLPIDQRYGEEEMERIARLVADWEGA